MELLFDRLAKMVGNFLPQRPSTTRLSPLPTTATTIDTLAKGLAQGISRRTTLKVLGSGLASTLLPNFPVFTGFDVRSAWGATSSPQLCDVVQVNSCLAEAEYDYSIDVAKCVTSALVPPALFVCLYLAAFKESHKEEKCQ